MRGEVRAVRWEAAGNRGASSVQGRARLQIQGRARERAHDEHALHACDAGGVEAERLVEHRRALPSQKEGMRCGARYTGRGAAGGGRPRRTQRVGQGSTADWWQGMGRSARRT